MKIVMFELWGTEGGCSGYTLLLSNGVQRCLRDDHAFALMTSEEYDYKEELQVPLSTPIRGIKSSGSLLKKGINLLPSYFRALRMLRRQKPDVLHIQQIGFSFVPIDLFFYWLMARASGRMVITMHNLISRTPNALTNAMIRVFLRRVPNQIIVHDQENKQTLQEQGTQNVSCIPIGLYGDLYPSPSNDSLVDMMPVELRCFLDANKGQRVILCFGRVTAYKGMENAVKAFGLVKDELFDLSLLIVGKSTDKSLKTNLLKEIKAMKTERVSWVDAYVPDSVVPELFSHADFCLLPYEDIFLSQSAVLHLAYTFRTPVIVNDVGGMGDSVRRFGTGILMETNDPHHIASSLQKAMEQELKSYEAAFDAIQQGLSWDQIAKTTLETYRLR